MQKQIGSCSSLHFVQEIIFHQVREPVIETIMLRKTCTENSYSKQIFDLWRVPGNLFSRAEANRLNRTKPQKRKHRFKWQYNHELQKRITPKQGPCSQMHKLHNFRHTTNTALFIKWLSAATENLPRCRYSSEYSASPLWSMLINSFFLSSHHLPFLLHSTYATSICF